MILLQYHSSLDFLTNWGTELMDVYQWIKQNATVTIQNLITHLQKPILCESKSSLNAYVKVTEDKFKEQIIKIKRVKENSYNLDQY